MRRAQRNAKGTLAHPASLCDLGPGESSPKLCFNTSMAPYQEARREIESAPASETPEQLMRRIVQRLAQVPRFDWVGFYLLNCEGVLELGPYVGAPTPHTRIPLNQG